MMTAFKDATSLITEMPLVRPEHPDISGARYVLLQRFPYMVFYTVVEKDIVIVAVEYATRNYVERVTRRTEKAR
ncbi:MAG: hypothetical protein KIT84_33390 [Labilithrix sp.]|nr:hypothetical protein [Labilithrix sp.]MCW5815942.1 hypothetical protein [Labilithrix sp.]